MMLLRVFPSSSLLALMTLMAPMAVIPGCAEERREAGKRASVDAAAPPARAARAARAPLRSELRPMLAELRQLAAAVPPPLSAARQQALSAMIERAYTSADPRRRARTRERLLECEDVTRGFETVLAHADPVVRASAAFELGGLAEPSSVPCLLLRLKDEPDRQTRLYLADALARLGNLAAIAELGVAMDGGDLAQKAGLMSMRILDDCGLPTGEAPSYAHLREQVTVLHRLWQRTGAQPPGASTAAAPSTRLTARLAKALIDLEGFQLRQVDEARYVLARMGRVVLPLLDRALHAEETYLRQHALEILREVGTPGLALTASVRGLLCRPAMRAEAIQTLGAIGARRSIPAILSSLVDPDLEVRCAAAGALGRLRADAAVEPLSNILTNPEQDMDLRVQAAFGLAMLDPLGPGLPFLLARRRADDYHTPTVDEFIAEAVAR